MVRRAAVMVAFGLTVASLCGCKEAQRSETAAAIGNMAATGPTGGTRQAHIVDPMFGQTALNLTIPSDWKYEGTVLRMPTGDPVLVLRVTSSDGLTGMQVMPTESSVWSTNPMQLRMMRGDGKNVRPPVSPVQYLTGIFVPGARPGAQNVQPTNAGPAATSAPAGTDVGRVSLQYDWNGHPIDEVLEARIQKVGTANIICETNVTGYHAPHGQLDAAAPVLASIQNSMAADPSWTAKEQAFDKANLQRIARQSAATNAQIMQRSAANIASIQRQGAAILARERAQSQASHDAAMGTAQSMGDVQTVINPATGQSGQISNQYNYSYADENGQVVQTNSTTYNPDAAMIGAWTQLQAVKPQ